jgi:hypothetical protein
MRPYLLTFVGGAIAKLPRYRRWHETEAAARDEALRVLAELDLSNTRAAHPAVIDGPDLGRAGVTIP